MDVAALSLCPARATVDDGLAFARYLDMSSDHAFRFLLGRRFDHVIAEAFSHVGHDLSFEYVTMAERGGRVVGIASAYSAEQHRAASDQPLERAAGWRRWRMGAFMALAAGLFEFLDRVPDGDHYLQAIAVDEDQRGQGTGSALIAAVEAHARDQGSQRLSLDVAASNPDARRLYERLGMTVEAESPRVLWIPGTSALRMVKPLRDSFAAERLT